MNVLLQSAKTAKAEMEATKSLPERRSITDKHMRTLRLLGFVKSDLLYQIYCLTRGY
jgi:hypothetical protein